MNTFPAAPGTFLRQFSPDGTSYVMPVIGWQHVSGNMVHPVFACGRQTINAGSVITVPGLGDEEFFVYPHTQTAATDFSALEEIMMEKLAEAEEAGELDTAPIVASASKTIPVTPEGKPDTRPLQFGAKTYNTKSFWHWETANAVFEIEGKEPYPTDPRAVKIKREEFAKLKRDGAVKIDPHAGLIIEEAPVEQAEDEEDDVSGLI